MKIAVAPICACKNNRPIWRHNTSVLHSRDITDQLWWCHNTKSEWQWQNQWSIIVLVELCLQDIKSRVRNKMIHLLLLITIWGHSWGNLPMIFTRDEKHWQITSLMTPKSLFTVTHALFFISLSKVSADVRSYIQYIWISMHMICACIFVVIMDPFYT